jgi:hypothetical protein
MAILRNGQLGVKFGRLLVITNGYRQNKRTVVDAKCDCGNVYVYRLDHLKSGAVNSCGCIQKKYETKIGDVFNRLIVIGEPYIIGKSKMAKVRCECGIEKDMNIRKLHSGWTKSCGCISVELTTERLTTHGLTNHPLYRVWSGVKDRCYNENTPAYKYYGGSGVKMFDGWKDDFVCFYDWAIDKWIKGLEIDKDILYVQKHGGKFGLMYSPEYCQFVTKKENLQQRRSSK